MFLRNYLIGVSILMCTKLEIHEQKGIELIIRPKWFYQKAAQQKKNVHKIRYS